MTERASEWQSEPASERASQQEKEREKGEEGKALLKHYTLALLFKHYTFHYKKRFSLFLL